MITNLRNIAVAVCLALALPACAGIDSSGRFTILEPRANPLTPTTLAQVESSYGIVLSAAVAYRRLGICPRGTTISVARVCADRGIVLQLQAADRKAHAAILAARRFQREYPTVSPIQMLQIASQAVDEFQLLASATGVSQQVAGVR